METIGDAEAGFSVRCDRASDVVYLVGWGFWSVEVSGALDAAMAAACTATPKCARAMIDMRDLLPMRDEGQKAFAAAVTTLLKHGVSRISVTTTSHLTKLQLLRIMKEAGASNVEFK